MAKSTKVPRATLAITMLDDPEFIGLCQTPEGREAYALFTALLMAAKDQDNGGKFVQDSAVVAIMVRWPVDAFRKSLALLQDKTNWLLIGASLIQIRSYKKWNSWGGNRDGAGRPIKTNSSGNQDAPLEESKPDVLAVVVDVVSKDSTATTPAPNSAAKPIKPHWSEPYGTNLKALVGSPKGGPWSWLGALARTYTQSVVMDALKMASEEGFENWKHAAGWITEVCKRKHLKGDLAKTSAKYDGDDSRY